MTTYEVKVSEPSSGLVKEVKEFSSYFKALEYYQNKTNNGFFCVMAFNEPEIEEEV